MSSIEKYAEFEEYLIEEGVLDNEDFKRAIGYEPSEKQRRLLLSRHKRERWGRHYVTVIRDKLGRFIKWRYARGQKRANIKGAIKSTKRARATSLKGRAPHGRRNKPKVRRTSGAGA